MIFSQLVSGRTLLQPPLRNSISRIDLCCNTYSNFARARECREGIRMLRRFGLLFCLWPAVVPAQTSQIVGRVSDPGGRPVEGATLTAIDAATSQQRTVTTNDRGDFAILLLRPAEYSMRVEM